MEITNQNTSAQDREIVGKILQSIDNKRLSLTVMPTEKCNFRCSYCYEDFELGRMPPNVVMGIKSLLTERSKDLNHLHISWFGGEPLLARQVIISLCQHIKELKHIGRNFKFTSSMTTNAFLLDVNYLRQLCDFGVKSYQITLDGDKETHNTTRIQANGDGTFDKIWKNLKEAKQSDINFNITLRVHFSPDNWSKTCDFIEKLRDEFGKDKRFRIFIKNIVRLGGKNDKEIKVFSKEEIPKKRSQLYKLYYGAKANINNIDPLSKGTYVCYASKPNNLVIRSNGQLAKCTVAFDAPQNKVGHIKPNGKLDLDQSKLSGWYDGISEMNTSKLSCPLSHMGKRTLDKKPQEVKIPLSELISNQ